MAEEKEKSSHNVHILLFYFVTLCKVLLFVWLENLETQQILNVHYISWPAACACALRLRRHLHLRSPIPPSKPPGRRCFSSPLSRLHLQQRRRVPLPASALAERQRPDQHQQPAPTAPRSPSSTGRSRRAPSPSTRSGGGRRKRSPPTPRRPGAPAPGAPAPRLPLLGRLVHALEAGDRARSELEVHHLAAKVRMGPRHGGGGPLPGRHAWISLRSV